MSAISIATEFTRRPWSVPAGLVRLLRRAAAFRRLLRYPQARRRHEGLLVKWMEQLHRQML